MNTKGTQMSDKEKQKRRQEQKKKKEEEKIIEERMIRALKIAERAWIKAKMGQDYDEYTNEGICFLAHKIFDELKK